MDEIEKLKKELERTKDELEKVSDELYDLKSIKTPTFLLDSHIELITDIQNGLNQKIEEYKDKEFDDMPVEEFLIFINTIKRYIQEYRKSYNV